MWAPNTYLGPRDARYLFTGPQIPAEHLIACSGGLHRLVVDSEGARADHVATLCDKFGLRTGWAAWDVLWGCLGRATTIFEGCMDVALVVGVLCADISLPKPGFSYTFVALRAYLL